MYAELLIAIRKWRNKADFERQWRGIVIGRFGRNGTLAPHRCSAIEVAINDILPGNTISDVLCCDGALNLHLSDKPYHIRYLVGTQALARLGVRSGDFQENKTARAHTDTRLGHNGAQGKLTR